jgi:uncharacterized radical SAM superfamily Fe-S cluster-containing enzyme
MDEKENAMESYEKEILAVIEEIKTLFLEKNNSYNNENDPMLNFTIGGILRHGDASYPGKYEAMKDYVMKHVAKVFSHNIYAKNIDESLKDIAVYMIIGIVMKRRFDKDIKNPF